MGHKRSRRLSHPNADDLRPVDLRIWRQPTVASPTLASVHRDRTSTIESENNSQKVQRLDATTGCNTCPPKLPKRLLTLFLLQAAKEWVLIFAALREPLPASTSAHQSNRRRSLATKSTRRHKRRSGPCSQASASRANGSDQRGRANDLQADEKTDHPSPLQPMVRLYAVLRVWSNSPAPMGRTSSEPTVTNAIVWPPPSTNSTSYPLPSL
ncbi:hypothetical protein Enr13x_10820 [Stieleria neptunia]|uniref:Uncharacterized protein n=1 Tax=Stieleria neptunia TaxID=2527979 RepID=A0A518HK75_9BACT|nr:hypothetical protein Enr13x_10820 [Stieleria neptunia]